MVTSELPDCPEIELILNQRCFGYEVLRTLFLLEPSLELIKSTSKIFNEDLFPFAELSQEIKEGVELITGYYSNHNSTDFNAQEELYTDYMRLFIGPGKVLVPLWESAYMNEDRLLFQKETLEVRKAYLKYNLMSPKFGQEPDDHLGLELDFLYELSKQAVENYYEENIEDIRYILEDQKAFLEEHLKKWVPLVSEKLINYAQTMYFRGLGRLLEGYAEVDQKILEYLLVKINGHTFHNKRRMVNE
ncbi:TorD/DmsD family molecular chaperone [Desulfitobacterium sp. AusDCA]|uniref:TorD/DmsD family molecular chaperone n=1 Tax=Desulfitobacterium sp. AusDCA TaxID=3240383 RepID=UPI003DA73E65